MGWHTEDELRKDAKKRAESQRNFERLLAALDEVKKKHASEKKQMRSAKKNKKNQKNHAAHAKHRILKSPIVPRIRILKRQHTASSSHSCQASDVDNSRPAEEAGDVADAQCEATPSSPHSWMPSDVPEDDGATPSSPHSWMPSPVKS